MRISDWSSDVCSSDLSRADCGPAHTASGWSVRRQVGQLPPQSLPDECLRQASANARVTFAKSSGCSIIAQCPQSGIRSEEHTSELQSLMRISYAVFCLQKKKTYTPTSHVTLIYR